MENLRDLKRLSALITAALKNRALTNGRLSAASYSAAAAEGRLDLERLGDSFLLFEDRGPYALLRFWVCAEDAVRTAEALKDLENLKPIVLEAAVRDGGGNMGTFLKSLEISGFDEAFQRIRLSAPAQEILLRSGSTDHSPQGLKPEDLEEAMALFKATFDPQTGCLPLASELAEDIKARKLLCVREGGAITGLLHFERSGKSLEISHIAVSKDRRGGGRAKALIASALASEGVGSLRLWVNETNEAALKLYGSLGLEASGMVSKVLVRSLQRADLEL